MAIWVPFANSCTAAFAEAVPVNVGVVTFVMLSALLDPLSLPAARCGVFANTSAALYTFNRPLLTVLPFKDDVKSVLFRMALLIAAFVADGLKLSSSDTAPATCGDAIDVPVRYW